MNYYVHGIDTDGSLIEYAALNEQHAQRMADKFTAQGCSGIEIEERFSIFEEMYDFIVDDQNPLSGTPLGGE